MSTIQQEKDLKKKASLLKEYLRGEVRLIQLAHFLRHEIETSKSKSWTRFCLDVQDWVRKNFELTSSVALEDETIEAFETSESLESELSPQGCFDHSSEHPPKGSQIWSLAAEDDQALTTNADLQVERRASKSYLKKLVGLSIAPFYMLAGLCIGLFSWFRDKARICRDLFEAIFDFSHSLWLKKKLAFEERLIALQRVHGVSSRAVKSLIFSLRQLMSVRLDESRPWELKNGSGKSARTMVGYTLISLGVALPLFFFMGDDELIKDAPASMAQADFNSPASILPADVTEEKADIEFKEIQDSPRESWSGDFLQQLVTYRKVGSSQAHEGSFQDMMADIRRFRTSIAPSDKGLDGSQVVDGSKAKLEPPLSSSGLADANTIRKGTRQTDPGETGPSPASNGESAKFLFTALARGEEVRTVGSDKPQSETPASVAGDPGIKSLTPNLPEKLGDESTWKDGLSDQDLENMLPSEDALDRSVNILVVGKEAQRRADTIVLSRFDLNTGQLRLLSFPRDTRVKIHRSKSEIKDKLGHTLRWGGIEMLKESLEEFSAINIDYYVEIDLILFRKLIDVMGGVEINVDSDYRYVDKAGGLSIDLKKGRQTLNGNGAEGFVRFRSDGQGDLGRIKRQQVFIRQFLAKLRSLRKLNWENLKVYARLPSFLVDVIRDVDSDIPSWKYLEFWQAFSKVSLDQIHFATLAGNAQNMASEHDGKLINYYISTPQQMEGGKKWFFKSQTKLSASDPRPSDPKLQASIAN